MDIKKVEDMKKDSEGGKSYQPKEKKMHPLKKVVIGFIILVFGLILGATLTGCEIHKDYSDVYNIEKTEIKKEDCSCKPKKCKVKKGKKKCHKG